MIVIDLKLDGEIKILRRIQYFAKYFMCIDYYDVEMETMMCDVEKVKGMELEQILRLFVMILSVSFLII